MMSYIKTVATETRMNPLGPDVGTSGRRQTGGVRATASAGRAVGGTTGIYLGLDYI